MEQLDPPDTLDWDDRRLWFEAREGALAEAGARDLSEQSCALMVDLQMVFCSGAWAAAIILSATIIETQMRQNDRLAKSLGDEDLRWLRRLRNALVHEDKNKPVYRVEDHWTQRDRWEKDAKRAVEAALRVLYARQP